MFIGRKEELLELESRINSQKFEMIPLYGRRRVGKTRLLEEFSTNKRTIFFTADQFGETSNLENLSQAITSAFSPEMESMVFPDFQTAFEAIAKHAESNPDSLLFIIDEYPYLAKAVKGISSLLQKIIDKKYLKLNNLMLILTGSQISFMEKQVLGYESPLYGRRTGQIKLMPLTLQEAHLFLPHIPNEDFLSIYGITGGIPLYLSMLDDHMTCKENIIKHVLQKNSFLYEEPGNLLMQELRTPNKYNDIIAAIASGSSEMKDIIGTTGIESGVLTKYLNTLIDLNIVEKKIPLTKIGKKKPLYVVSDGLFRFWYRYVPKYKNFIETNKTNLIWEKIEADLPDFTAIEFEHFCRNWIYQQNGTKELPFLISEVGSWWGNNPINHKPTNLAEEIDIIGIGVEKNNLLIGECKWKNKDTDVDIAQKLMERSNFFPYPNKLLVIFSKSKFTKKLQHYAIKNNIQLISYHKMLERGNR
ncbi:MAG: ATP-binding protein [Lachnospiraceae bacterium]|nr:ATP-binding protein [Lachnospiraceae bacterium]